MSDNCLSYGLFIDGGGLGSLSTNVRIFSDNSLDAMYVCVEEKCFGLWGRGKYQLRAVDFVGNPCSPPVQLFRLDNNRWRRRYASFADCVSSVQLDGGDHGSPRP